MLEKALAYQKMAGKGGFVEIRGSHPRGNETDASRGHRVQPQEREILIERVGRHPRVTLKCESDPKCVCLSKAGTKEGRRGGVQKQGDVAKGLSR